MKKYFLMFAVILLSANGVKAQDGYLTNTFPDGSQFEGYFENGVIKHVYHFVNSNDKTEFLFTVKELKSILN